MNLVRAVRALRLVPAAVVLFAALLAPAGRQATAQTSGPPAPVQYSPANGQTGLSNPVTLAWYASSGAVAYDVAYIDAAGGSYTYSGYLYNQTSDTICGLEAGHTYYWYVFACDYYACNQSAGWSFSMAAIAPTTPVLASPVNGSTGLSSPVTVSWYQAGSDSHYYVFWSDATTGGGYADSGDLGSQTSYSLSGLMAGHEYQWSVYGCTTWCSQSNTWYFTLGTPGPTPPQQLSPANGATGLTSPVTLSWTAEAGATEYQTAWIDAAGGGYTYSGPLYQTSYTLAGLVAGHTYYWAVFACDFSACAQSALWSFSLTVAAASPPQLSAPANGATGVSNPVTLVWQQTGSDTNYEVGYQDADTGGGYTFSGFLGAQTSYTLPTLTGDHLYYWFVYGCATNACVTSVVWSFTLQPAAASAPQLLSPGNGATGLTNPVTLSWSAASGDSSYEVGYLDANSGATSYTFSGFLGSQTSYTLPTLVSDHLYDWFVYGCSATACLTSAVWTFSMQQAAPTAPQLASPANGATAVANPVVLNWGAAGSDTNYEAGYIDATAGASGYTLSGFLGPQTSYALPTLVGNHIYDWLVYGCTASGCVPSAVWSFTVSGTAPTAPQLVSPANGATAVSNPVTFTWSAAAGDTDYYVYYQDLTGSGGNASSGDLGAQTSYSLSNLVAGDEYEWSVFGCRASCAVSATWTFTVAATAPGVPQPVSPAYGATDLGLTPTLSWQGAANAVSGSTIYDVALFDAQTQTQTGPYLMTTDPTVQAQVPSSQGLILGRGYFWTVAACTGQVCSAWSPYRLFTTAPPPSAAAQTSPADGADLATTSTTLAWSAPASNDYPGQTHFFVNLFDEITGQYTQHNFAAGTITSDAVRALASRNTYVWSILSCNGPLASQDCAASSWDAFSAAAIAATYPGFTTSWYIQSNSLAGATSLGQMAATQSTAGASSPRLIIVDFGGQWSLDGNNPSTSGVYGTVFASLTVGTPGSFIPESQNDPNHQVGGIEEVAEAFIRGYASQNPSGTAKIVIGTNNNLFLNSAMGARWADVTAAIASYVRAYISATNFTVSGGDDIQELQGTGGDRSASEAWSSGYYAEAGGQPFYNFGSCDNCPEAPPSSGQSLCKYDPAATPPATSCSLSGSIGLPGTIGGWTVQDVATLAGEDGHEYVIPEIYSTEISYQWAYILLYADAAPPLPPGNTPPGYIDPPGILTSCLASIGITAQQAWTAAWNVVIFADWSFYLDNVNPYYATDIGYEGRITSIPPGCQ